MKSAVVYVDSKAAALKEAGDIIVANVSNTNIWLMIYCDSVEIFLEALLF